LFDGKSFQLTHQMVRLHAQAWICHELRNPLHAVIGLTDLLLIHLNLKNKAADTSAATAFVQASSLRISSEETFTNDSAPHLDDEINSHLKYILNSSRLMSTIVNDVLDLSKLDEGKMQLDMMPTDIYALLKESCVGQAAAARWNHVRVKNYNDEKAEDSAGDESNEIVQLTYDVRGIAEGAQKPTGWVPGKLLGDPTRLQQILINLISNSLKFTSSGHVTVRASILDYRSGADSNQTTNSKSQALVSFEVKDTGMGVAQENIPKLFNAYSQANASIGRNFGGTGLGLSIVQKLVEIMGGRVKVESTLGVGTTVSFKIWMDIVEEECSSTTVVQDVHGNPRTCQDHMKIYPSLPNSGSSLFITAQSSHRVTSNTPQIPFLSVTFGEEVYGNAGQRTAEENETQPAASPVPEIISSIPKRPDSCIFSPASTSSPLVSHTKTKASRTSTPSPKADTFSSNQSPLKNIAALDNTFPRSLSASPMASPPLRLGSSSASISMDSVSEPLKVLLAEDNALLQNIGKTMLLKAGFTVETANNGKEALELLQRHGERRISSSKNTVDECKRKCDDEGFDVCLMDLQMPIMDGFQATMKMRESGYELPVIALTANATAA
jgi:signal transduction histidine kinase/CheY-like chemotaxis protein